MALSSVTVTGNLADYLGTDYDPRRTKMYLKTNAEKNLIADKSTGEIRLGGGKVEIATNGDFTATHWAPGVDGNPQSWQTTYMIDAVDPGTRQRRQVEIGPFTVTTSGLLSALIEQQAVPADYLTAVTQQLDTKVAAAETAKVGAETARDAAKDISNISTSDDVVETLVKGTAGAGPKTRAALSASYAATGVTGLHVDVTAPPYSAAGDGVADDYAAINQASLDVEAAGGGTVFLPLGTYRISAHLSPRNRVRYQGAGIGRTVIAPYQSAAFTGHGDLATPIESPSWVAMTWDGSAIPGSNSLKGQFSEYLRDATWQEVECKNFTATGFGSDFLPGGRYINCVATGNGRGQAVGGPGMSGFGIGTGKYEVENVLVSGCIATENTNYGIFVEKQGAAGNAPFYSEGVRIVGNYVSGNGWGVGGCGVSGPVYADNICADNAYDGITLHEGTGLAPLGQPDKRAIVSDNQCYGNGRDGINIDYEKNSLAANQAYHLIANNACYSNARDGLRLVGSRWASDVVRGIKIAGNQFTRNAGLGIHIEKPATAEAGASIADLNIHDNDISGNGGTAGILVAATTTRLRVRSNKVYDDQSTKTQDYGLSLPTGYTHTDALVVDNDLRANLTGPIQSAATFAGASEVGRNNGATTPTAQHPHVQLGPKTVTKGAGSLPVTVLQNNDPGSGDNGTRVYIVPKGSTTAGVGGVLKIFGDDYSADQANYRDLGIYFSQDQAGDTGTRGDGVFWINAKSAGTKAGLVPDIGFSMQDGSGVGGRFCSPIVGGQSKYTFVVGPGKPEHATKRALVMEVQGDVGFDGAADRSIYWETTAGTSSNVLTFERTATNGQLRVKLGGSNRLLLTGAGDLVLGDQASDMGTASTAGFLHVRAMSGTPTGTPTTFNGAVPLAFDRTGGKLWAYYGGSWKSVTLS